MGNGDRLRRQSTIDNFSRILFISGVWVCGELYEALAASSIGYFFFDVRSQRASDRQDISRRHGPAEYIDKRSLLNAHAWVVSAAFALRTQPSRREPGLLRYTHAYKLSKYISPPPHSSPPSSPWKKQKQTQITWWKLWNMVVPPQASARARLGIPT